MREKRQKQMPLMLANKSNFPQARELAAISDILDKYPIINDLAYQDLCKFSSFKKNTGAEGMSAEQVVRAAIVKAMFGYAYRSLAFHISDSDCLRQFCLIGNFGKSFKKSALQENIKALSAETLEQINHIIVGHAKDEKIEAGREIRVDCTVVESNIHHPTDSSLLFDVVRVLTRLLVKARESGVSGLHFQKHNKRAKRRAMGILNARTKKDRCLHYKDLLKVTKKTVGYVRAALPVMESLDNVTSFQQFLDMLAIAGEMRHYLPLADKVISQAERRVIFGETVPAHEKIVSIFEEHTDIIIKDRRETYFGHKICLTGGRSNLILDCQILDGNPPDSALTLPMLDRQKAIYGRYPLKAAFDGGFASKDNVTKAKAKERGVKDICFSKKRGIKVQDMCRSEYVYKRLRNFRAGIESGISWLKRSFGLGRCNWKGWESFKSYVWASVVSANLLTLARTNLAV